MQPWHIPFPIWNQSVFPCLVLTLSSWPAYRFLRRQVRWSGIPISWRSFHWVVIYIVKDIGVTNKAEIDVFLEFSCFFYDPTDVGNLISDSSAFSKSSLNIWKFTVHVVLKPGLENFEHYFASMWSEVKSFSHVWLFATPWTVAYQAPPSMGSSRKECWSGLPFPSPGDLPKPGIEPRSPGLQADALLSEPPGKLPLLACEMSAIVQ